MKTLVGNESRAITYARLAQRPRAWVVSSRKPQHGSYFFKGRFGKRSGNSLLDGSKLRRGTVFSLQPRENGYVTAPQLEVLWRAVRRRTRRFAVNLRRTPVSSHLQPTAGQVVTERKKGGRMGSGKSPTTGLMKAALRNGNLFFFSAELRKRPLRGFLPLRSVLKKISPGTVIKYFL